MDFDDLKKHYTINQLRSKMKSMGIDVDEEFRRILKEEIDIELELQKNGHKSTN